MPIMTEAWPEPEGGYKPIEQIGDPLTDDEVRDLGFDIVGWHGWRPQSQELVDRLNAVDARRTDRTLSFVDVPFRIPGTAECTVCDETAEASTCGTPTCSWICTAVLMEQLLPAIADSLHTRGDGSGGCDAVQPITPTRSREWLSVVPRGSFSVETALERLVDCCSVLERHGARMRGAKMAYCPFHPNDRTPAMSLYERGGKSRVHCHSCDWSGDALDLEAALAGEDLKTTIRRWS
jgi:hypothetical protein